ncbi:MAG: RDD family protein [Caldilineaceae bacterium]|nr:RDD family protein [Caldilinea sp.]MCB9114595.1 RDD family protein [Caldilineaceae bacterium]
MTRAGFFARFVAFLVDNIALSILAWVLGALVAPLFAGVAATGIPILSWVAAGFSILTLLILPFFQFFYFGWMWSRPSGQSYGMRFLNIRVTRRDGSGLGFWRAALRGTVGYWLSGLVFGLGFLWAAIDSRKEAWHDKLFDTGVVVA